MIYIYEKLYSNERWNNLYKSVVETINDYSMLEYIKKGVLVGFSGGADSVMLMLMLSKLRQEYGDFKILAFHVNHLIRGEEAYRDESFARDFSNDLKIEFLSERIDVPALAKISGIGVEEAARNARYSAFNSILQGRNDISSIATAHNSTDNLETIIMNMLRGTGCRGLAGIPPLRQNVIRPLIRISKKEITDILSMEGVPFVFDSTNSDNDYKRNFIRNEILPSFSKIVTMPERTAMRLSENLRCDDDFIESVKDDFLSKNVIDGHVSKCALKSLHKAVFIRVVDALVKEKSDKACERIHFDSIYNGMNEDHFSISLPGKISFIINGDDCFVQKKSNREEISYKYNLSLGVNEFQGVRGVILLSTTPFDNSYTNVYKISTQTTVSFDIISDSLYIRSRVEGDSYIYGGMTRKLKKVFNDKSVPPDFRNCIPILCDKNGILWVPGLPVRDGSKGGPQKKLHVALAYKIQQTTENNDFTLYKATDW